MSFTSSLAAPIVRAEAAAQPAAATTGSQPLSTLWSSWVKQGGSSAVKPDTAFAYNYFTKAGASHGQAEILVANAQSAGQLTKPMPASSAGAVGDFFKKLFKIKPAAPKATVAATSANGTSATGTSATGTSATGTSATGTSATGTSAPVASSHTAAPQSWSDKIKGIFTGNSSSSEQLKYAAPSDKKFSLSPTYEPGTPGGPPRPGWGDKVQPGLNGVGDKAFVAKQKVTGVVHDISSAVTTGLLTAKDKIDIRQFYTIPVSDTGAVKITGGSNYDVRFTNKGWVNQQVSSGTNLVDAIKANEAMGTVKQLETQFGPGQATRGPVGSLLNKFSTALSNFKNKITGKSSLPAAEGKELTKLQIQGNLLEHAQGLTQAQNAINVRIDKLSTEALKYGRPMPDAEIANLKRTLNTIEVQKKDVIKKLETVQRGGDSVVSSGVKWALYSVGITASVNIIKQVVAGEKIDFKSALSFVGQPSFWGGTAGGFVGSMVVSHLASSLIPGGGIFMKILPGFLGAALGYEVGAGFFGGGSGDWIGTIGQTLASAGGYALAYSLLGGAMAPGIALIGAGIAAGALFNFLYAKLKGGGGGMEGEQIPPPDLGAPLPDPQANGAGTGAGNAVALPGVQASPVGAGNLEAQKHSMQAAYTEYINYLKDGKVVDARGAFDRYTAAKNQIQGARQANASTPAASR